MALVGAAKETGAPKIRRCSAVWRGAACANCTSIGTHRLPTIIRIVLRATAKPYSLCWRARSTGRPISDCRRNVRGPSVVTDTSAAAL